MVTLIAAGIIAGQGLIAAIVGQVSGSMESEKQRDWIDDAFSAVGDKFSEYKQEAQKYIEEYQKLRPDFEQERDSLLQNWETSMKQIADDYKLSMKEVQDQYFTTMTTAIETGNTAALNSIETFQSTMNEAIEKRSVERNNILYGIPASIDSKSGKIIPGEPGMEQQLEQARELYSSKTLASIQGFSSNISALSEKLVKMSNEAISKFETQQQKAQERLESGLFSSNIKMEYSINAALSGAGDVIASAIDGYSTSVQARNEEVESTVRNYLTQLQDSNISINAYQQKALEDLTAQFENSNTKLGEELKSGQLNSVCL